MRRRKYLLDCCWWWLTWWCRTRWRDSIIFDPFLVSIVWPKCLSICFYADGVWRWRHAVHWQRKTPLFLTGPMNWKHFCTFWNVTCWIGPNHQEDDSAGRFVNSNAHRNGCTECCRWDGINCRWQFAVGNKTRTWIERESLWNFGREAIGANPPRRQTGGRMRRVNVGRCRYRGGQMNTCVKMGNVRLGRTDWNNRATLLARATKHGGLSSTFFPFFVSFSSSAFTYTHGISMADKQAKG